MKTKVATYSQTSFNGGRDEPLFAIATDGESVSIVFPSDATEEDILDYRIAIGSRVGRLIDESTEGKEITPEYALTLIGYNMMVNIIPEEEDFDTFSDALLVLEKIYSGLQYTEEEYTAEAYSPLFSYPEDGKKVEGEE